MWRVCGDKFETSHISPRNCLDSIPAVLFYHFGMKTLFCDMHPPTCTGTCRPTLVSVPYYRYSRVSSTAIYMHHSAVKSVDLATMYVD